MTRQYRVQHKTTFNYTEEVSLSQQMLRLTPRPTPCQTVHATTIIVEPAPIVRQSALDYFGNTTTYVSVQEPHRRLIVSASATVTVASPTMTDIDASTPWTQVAAAMRSPANRDALFAAGYCFGSPQIDLPADLRALTDDLFTDDRPLLAATRELTTRIHREFDYRGGVTDVWTPVSRVLAQRQGFARISPISRSPACGCSACRRAT
ncbi:MAG: transglutaminase N-terminal domain-containing protein [Burkholderiaceae bacterium]